LTTIIIIIDQATLLTFELYTHILHIQTYSYTTLGRVCISLTSEKFSFDSDIHIKYDSIQNIIFFEQKENENFSEQNILYIIGYHSGINLLPYESELPIINFRVIEGN